jgi:hypothetical protein
MKPSPRIGDRVRVPGWVVREEHDLFGTIIEIDGGYYYIEVENNPRFELIELYSNEFDVVSK